MTPTDRDIQAAERILWEVDNDVELDACRDLLASAIAQARRETLDAAIAIARAEAERATWEQAARSVSVVARQIAQKHTRVDIDTILDIQGLEATFWERARSNDGGE